MNDFDFFINSFLNIYKFYRKAESYQLPPSAFKQSTILKLTDETEEEEDVNAIVLPDYFSLKKVNDN